MAGEPLSIQFVPAPVLGAATDPGKPEISQHIQFEKGSYEIKPEFYPVIHAVAEIMRNHPDFTKVEIRGYSDDQTEHSPGYNNLLSERRAKAVMAYLTDREGIDPSRLRTKGFGDEGSLAQGHSREVHQRNRRVEFAVIERAPPCAYTYSDWGECHRIYNTQTRTVLSSAPENCVGTPGPLSQFCIYTTPPPPPCAYTYSDWGKCQSDNTQSRTVSSAMPEGCVGRLGPLSQACEYVPPKKGILQRIKDYGVVLNGGPHVAYDGHEGRSHLGIGVSGETLIPFRAGSRWVFGADLSLSARLGFGRPTLFDGELKTVGFEFFPFLEVGYRAAAATFLLQGGVWPTYYRLFDGEGESNPYSDGSWGNLSARLGLKTYLIKNRLRLGAGWERNPWGDGGYLEVGANFKLWGN